MVVASPPLLRFPFLFTPRNHVAVARYAGLDARREPVRLFFFLKRAVQSRGPRQNDLAPLQNPLFLQVSADVLDLLHPQLFEQEEQ